jgi:hypothetical protein
MENSTLLFAEKNLLWIGEEDGFKTIILDNRLHIELKSGKTLELSDNEIEYQAIEYLQREISYIKNNF